MHQILSWCSKNPFQHTLTSTCSFFLNWALCWVNNVANSFVHALQTLYSLLCPIITIVSKATWHRYVAYMNGNFASLKIRLLEAARVNSPLNALPASSSRVHPSRSTMVSVLSLARAAAAPNWDFLFHLSSTMQPSILISWLLQSYVAHLVWSTIDNTEQPASGIAGAPRKWYGDCDCMISAHTPYLLEIITVFLFSAFLNSNHLILRCEGLLCGTARQSGAWWTDTPRLQRTLLGLV